MADNQYKVLILDMQPIDPPVGGGRLRLLGLYHNLGKNFLTQYIGSYDWPGEKFRDHLLSDTLREVDIPLSNEHFEKCRKWQERVSGKTIIDSTFSLLAHLSPQYVEFARSEVKKADIVIFSHPWVYPLIKDLLNKDTQIIIYDSQNVEGYLRFSLLDDGGFGTEIVREVVKTEYELCHLANIIITCSAEDCELYNKIYAIPYYKMKIVPNGVFIEQITPTNAEERQTIKKQLGIGKNQVALFIGSDYSPNVEACNFIRKDLAPGLPEILFIIAGGVGSGINKNLLNEIHNVKITGSLSEEEKYLYLAASDLAINPMFSGSGTNIKMFDFMAAGLPIITTSIGARGITKTDSAGIVITGKNGFQSYLQDLLYNNQKAQNFGKANRELVEKNYSFEKISPQLGTFLKNRISRKKNESGSTTRKRENDKFAIMSSWNLRCGIAEHTRRLANEFETNNIDFRIIANTNNDLVGTYLIDDISKNVYYLWNYDYLYWKDSQIDIVGITQVLVREGITKFNIQYHTGFYNQGMLVELVKACSRAKIEVYITLHNSKELYPDTLLEINKCGVKIIVHSVENMILLQDQGIHNIVHIPLGVMDITDEETSVCRNRLGITGTPVISSFGFLRPHKGALEAIEAISLLRNKYPNIQFLGLTALYPSEDSEKYYRNCLDRINELNLNDNINLFTDYLDMNQIIQYLHASDIIVLPYHDSKEGSSAAANTVLSAKRSLVISKSSIFKEIKHVCYEIDSIDPLVIASEIQNVLSKPDLLSDLKEKIVYYVNRNSYKKIANKYLELILGDE